ncbi:lysophospholipid acyltransferase family protein [Lachancea thermotolerans CBS 6340]|uniref:KLTH0C08096p n=1 Tax=Lachancea thermotolerans (strain ATCC 56472 / CBS 6340 / NRRL Y-8284) TaxID=559295 RepID=C5DEC6_LACTC|nr:KLTH0C08096p [Lachancea thermotolerans CBS 6340]CAR22137.1 KLTH0C08096p [Lachancea thermotolerans CBS 6340]
MSVSFLAQRAVKLLVTLASIVIFIQGAFVIVTHQVLTKTFLTHDPIRMQKHLDRSKKSFIILLITILTIVAPSGVRITTDNRSIPKNTMVKDLRTGGIISSMKQKSVLISNHQIYTDWVFLWWLAYTGDLAGNVYIMLKNSLAKIPIMGYGMRNYNFIFMNRKWSKDRINLANHLGNLDHNARGVGRLAGKHPSLDIASGKEVWSDNGAATKDHRQIRWPYTLIIFPEGTNLSANTREKSRVFSEKANLPIFNNLVLPRVTGLRFSLQELRNSCEVVYDTTIGYSGVKQNEYGQDIYQLSNIFLRGHSPDLVDIYIRAFNLKDIPLDDEEEFTKWLLDVWHEKDKLLDTFYAKGSFDLDPNTHQVTTGTCKIKSSEVAQFLILPLLSLAALVAKILRSFC